MSHVFGSGGTLARVLDEYEPREEQAELAAAVEKALADGTHLLAEAGTGTGKSLAYLVPALAAGRRVVVATATKALQEQLLTKDVPLAAAALGRDVHVAVLKGRQNYLCRNRLQGFALLGGSLFARPEDGRAFDAMRPWIDSTETGDRAELAVEPSHGLWSELAVGSDRCLGRTCAHVGTCFSEAARERASHADLVIVNHALYFADLVAARAARRRRRPPRARRGRLRRGAPAGGDGGDLARRPGVGRPGCTGSPATSNAPAGRRTRRRRRGRSTGSSAQATVLFDGVCPASGRARLRRPPVALCRALAERLAELASAL